MTNTIRRNMIIMASKDFLARALAELAAAYPNFNLTKATAAVYASYLEDVTDEELGQAIQRVIATSKFFPSVSELRGATAEVKSSGVPQLSAGEAWGTFIRLSGLYDNDKPLPPEADCPEAVRLTIRALGWTYLCASTNGMADRAHFMKTYDAIVERQRQQEQLPPQLRASNSTPATLALRGLANTLSGK